MEKIWGFVGSGGGAKGAWGAGVSHYLVDDLERDYKYLSGTSTGALFMSLIALHDTLSLKKAYLNVSNEDIYKISPYRFKNGKIKMNYAKIAWNILINKSKTFGDSTKLRENLLPKFFLERDFNLINKLDKELITAVTNLTKGGTEYQSTKTENYEEFHDCVFASTCAAPSMSLVE